MNLLKKAGFISATIFLMFFIACGGGGNNNGGYPFNGGGTRNNPQAVSISITPSLSVQVYETGTFDVTMQNTYDFTLSAPAGSGCVKSYHAVECTPIVAGTYTVTVTATDDKSKTASATLTVLQGIIGISPTSATLGLNGNGDQVFTVTGINADDFTLSAPTDAGCVKNGNVVRCSPTKLGIYDITVTATADASKTASASLYVPFHISPSDATILFGGTQTFSVTPSIDFTISAPTDAGCVKSALTINNAARIECKPQKAGTYNIKVIPTEDPGLAVTAKLTLNANISISPSTATITIGQSQKFGVTTSPSNSNFMATATSDAGCVINGPYALVCTPKVLTTNESATYVVKVVLSDYPSKTATASLLVKPPTSSKSATFEAGESQTSELSGAKYSFDGLEGDISGMREIYPKRIDSRIPIPPTAEEEKVKWRYTFANTANDWTQPGFDDSSWSEGFAGFGTYGTPGSDIGTVWNTDNIWLRRSFEWDGYIPENAAFALIMHHDEDVDVYINGVNVFKEYGRITNYDNYGIFSVPILRDVLLPWENHIAVYCKQTDGGQFIDVEIVFVEE